MLSYFTHIKHKYYQLFLIMVLGLNLNLMSQTSVFGDSSQYFRSLEEEITLILNRHIFADGETVHFSAIYSLNGILKPKKQVSNILYVSLVDCNNKTFSRQKYLIQAGVVNGKLQIPEDIPTGHYFINAYTKYLRNFTSESFATVPLIVINHEAPPQNPANATLHIRSEFGGIIPDTQNKLYISTGSYIANHSKSIKLIGLKLDTNINIALFKNGLGSITIDPVKNENYVLEIVLNDGSIVRDTINPELIATPKLALKKLNNEISLRVLNPASSAEEESSDYSISILDERLQSQSEHIYRNEMYIPIETLQTHFNYFVLKSKDTILDILAYYKFPSSEIKANVNIESTDTSHNDNLELTVDFTGITKVDHSCVSVNLKGTSWSDFGDIPEIFIQNPRLLKSFILNQSGFSDELKKQVDIITGLYRESMNTPEFYERIERLEETEIKYLPDVRDVSISGKILNQADKQAIPGQKVYMSVLFDNPQLHIYETNTDGSFVFSGNNLFGNQTIYLGCGMKNPDSESEILIDVDFFNDSYGFNSAPLPEQLKSAPDLNQLILNANITSAYEIESSLKSNQQRNASKYFGGQKLSIDLKDYIAFEDLKEVITEIIGPLKIKRIGSKYELRLLDENDKLLQGTPLILVDNLPVFDVDELLKIHPSKIETIEIINKNYVYGKHAINGIVMFTSKTANFGGVAMPAGSVFLEYQMRNDNQPLVKAANNMIQSQASSVPVFKNSLLWSAFDTQTNDSVKLRFQRPDYSGTFQVKVRCYESGTKFSMSVQDYHF